MLCPASLAPPPARALTKAGRSRSQTCCRRSIARTSLISLGRAAVALVWLYNGLWCKVLGRCPGHAAIVAGLPGLDPTAAARALVALGLLETAIAAWVLSGRAPVRAAQLQALLLVAMNAGGLLWGLASISDPGAMIVQNTAFLVLVWMVARTDTITAAPGQTAWRRGRFDTRAGPPSLLFGHMYEDWRVEADVFLPRSSVFCIASAGSTAIALAARGHDVTAVDINPAQIDYVRERLRGAATRRGTAERFMGVARGLAPIVGWTAARRRRFLELDDPAEQLRSWARLDTARFRCALSWLLAPSVLRTFYDPDLMRALPQGFGGELRRRFRRGFARHANATNPYVWRLLLGFAPPTTEIAPTSCTELSIRLECADAAEYLESCPAGRFQAFSLSNILDGADALYARRLFSAVRRAAAPQAVVVLRSFGTAATGAEEENAARDRAMLWGSVRILEAETLTA